MLMEKLPLEKEIENLNKNLICTHSPVKTILKNKNGIEYKKGKRGQFLRDRKGFKKYDIIDGEKTLSTLTHSENHSTEVKCYSFFNRSFFAFSNSPEVIFSLNNLETSPSISSGRGILLPIIFTIPTFQSEKL